MEREREGKKERKMGDNEKETSALALAAPDTDQRPVGTVVVVVVLASCHFKCPVNESKVWKIAQRPVL